MSDTMSDLARHLVAWHAQQAGILEDDGEDFDPEPPPRSHWDATKLTAEVQAIINRIEEEGPSANQLRMLGYLHPALKELMAKVAKLRRDAGIRAMRDHGMPARAIANAMGSRLTLSTRRSRRDPDALALALAELVLPGEGSLEGPDRIRQATRPGSRAPGARAHAPAIVAQAAAVRHSAENVSGVRRKLWGGLRLTP